MHFYYKTFIPVMPKGAIVCNTYYVYAIYEATFFKKNFQIAVPFLRSCVATS